MFSIAMGAKYLSYVKSIAAFALTFVGYIISVLASVPGLSTQLKTHLPFSMFPILVTNLC